MKLGTKGRYAVMAMVDLACNSNKTPIALIEIANRQGLSLAYLEQLFLKLRRSGLVTSRRGQSGGYHLGHLPSQIQISEILDAIDEPIQTTRCRPGALKGCSGRKERCLTHDLWAGLGKQMRNYLSSISLDDICKRKLGI